MAAPSKPPPQLHYVTPDDAPELAEAAALTIAVVKLLQSESLTEVIERVQSGYMSKTTAQAKTFVKRLDQLRLTEEQVNLLTKYQPVLRLISVRSPMTTLSVCPVCFVPPTENADGTFPVPHGWQLVSGASPASCRVTAHCPGRPVRVKEATKIQAFPGEDGRYPTRFEVLNEDAAEEEPVDSVTYEEFSGPVPLTAQQLFGDFD